MYLVDTSVVIDILNGTVNEKTELYGQLYDFRMPYGISPFTRLEVLQGIRDDESYQKVSEYLDSIKTYWLTDANSNYDLAAGIYRRCRKSRITPRSTIDVLIAATAISHGLVLLHNDRDFELMASVIEELSIA